MAGKSGTSHDAPIRVALYARVSTLGKGQDTENQLVQLRQFATTQDWTIAQEYVDRVTGKHSDREEFQRLFQDAAQRRWDVVLFWSLDRFSREGVRETLNHLERLATASAGARSPSSTWTPAASSKMRFWRS